MNISVLNNISGLRIRSKVAGFFTWWLGELRVLMPRSLETWLGGDVRRVLVRIAENNARLLLDTAGHEELLGQCSLASEGVGFDGLRRTITEKVPSDGIVEVELSEQSVLRAEIFLPLATEYTLNEVVGFELDRFTPFNAEQVGYAFRIVERIPERDKLKLELCIVRRDYLSELQADLVRLGLSVDGVYAGFSGSATNDATATVRANLLPADMRPATEPLWTGKNKKLLAVLLLLLGITIIFPMSRQTAAIERLETEVASIMNDARQAGEKQQLLVARLDGQELLANMKNNHPTKLENLRRITELIPDNTWVSRLVMDDHTVTLKGESNKSSNLIEILEQTDRFNNVEFTSPVTSNLATQMERYEIQLQFSGQK